MSAGAAAGAAIEVGLAGSTAEIDALAPAWRELGEEAGTAPFMQPEWVRAHLRAFERASDVRLIVARQSGRLCGVLPMIAERAWFRGLYLLRWRSAANHHTLRFDLIARDGAEGAAVAAAVWAFLERQRWGVIELRDIPEGGRAEGIVAAAAAAGHPTGAWESPMQTRLIPMRPLADLPPGFAATSRKFRAELRRTRRRLQELGDVSFETIVEPSAADLQAFFALEAAGWKGQAGGNAVLRKPAQVRRFYTELAQGASASRRFALHRLRLGEIDLAMSYGLRGRGAFFPLRWCYNESYAGYGPGHLLIEAIVNECAAMGVERTGFVGEDFAYERKWSHGHRPQRFFYVFPKSWFGRRLRALKFPRGERAMGQRGPVGPDPVDGEIE